jgi:hypothetical protein
MKSLRKNPEAATAHAFMNVHEPHASAQAEPLAPARWDWREVRRVLVVRLRSIGDTVLATPTLHALRRFLPDARIDVLLEDWVAPLLDEFEDVSNVITVERKSAKSRARVARALRSTRYDVAYNLHGGTTSTFLTRATGARHRVGYADYRFIVTAASTITPRRIHTSCGAERNYTRSNNSSRSSAGRACP